ncbi:hypothetical protein HYH03_001931 [Edaphochlamys debaryana]|uniref:Glycosyltransferase family 92 protein n=1 Tax=Edaphochlamys debaryana TaxID=47281 RepID=A0A835YCD2_9CHLO|nr:hypothetical protein HYH03_001931 [Edaphochlamys debaryana]|eukprot:KAG2500357.1 hypothetical protein HYH03_001931 [Edaphochlamys debaryana]
MTASRLRRRLHSEEGKDAADPAVDDEKQPQETAAEQEAGDAGGDTGGEDQDGGGGNDGAEEDDEDWLPQIGKREGEPEEDEGGDEDGDEGDLEQQQQEEEGEEVRVPTEPRHDVLVFEELLDYLEEMDSQPLVNCSDAARNQARPTSAELGLAPWDPMQEIESLPARVAFLNYLTKQVCGNGTGAPGPGTTLRVSAFTVWAGNLWGLRRTLMPWLQYHTQLGVCRYYVAYQGRDLPTLKALRSIHSVRLILVSRPFASERLRKRYQAYERNHTWGHLPGNYKLMIKQDFCGDLALRYAHAERQQWMAHIDPDEMMLPATTLQADLASAPPWAAQVRLNNHEALIESFDVVNKYEEVTLFKTHDSTIANRTGDLQWRLRLGTYDSYYQVYYNGKAVARTDRGFLHPWGPHEFWGKAFPTFKDPVHNPEGESKMVDSRMTLLHLSYASWRDLLAKAHSSCPPEAARAARGGNHTWVEQCFVLEFDRLAFLAAVEGERSAQDFWTINSLFSEHAMRKDSEDDDDPVQCRVYHDIERLKELLVRDRLLLRVTQVQQTLRAHELAIRLLARAMGIHIPPPDLSESSNMSGGKSGGSKGSSRIRGKAGAGGVDKAGSGKGKGQGRARAAVGGAAAEAVAALLLQLTGSDQVHESDFSDVALPPPPPSGRGSRGRRRGDRAWVNPWAGMEGGNGSTGSKGGGAGAGLGLGGVNGTGQGVEAKARAEEGGAGTGAAGEQRTEQVRR